jgi:hypothetical protein
MSTAENCKNSLLTRQALTEQNLYVAVAEKLAQYWPMSFWSPFEYQAV